MANTMTVVKVEPSDRAKVIIYKVTLSGSYVQASRGTTTGEQLLLNSATTTGFPYANFGVRGPDFGYPVQGPGGFACRVLPGATPNQWLLQIFGATNGTELAAGAYGAAYTGDQDFYVAFEGGNF